MPLAADVLRAEAAREAPRGHRRGAGQSANRAADGVACAHHSFILACYSGEEINATGHSE